MNTQNEQILQFQVVNGELRIVDLWAIFGKRFVKLTVKNASRCPNIQYKNNDFSPVRVLEKFKRMKRNSKELATICYRANVVEKRRQSRKASEVLVIKTEDETVAQVAK